MLLALALACSMLAIPACAGSTKVDEVWRSPDWRPGFQHVVVFAIAKREGVRRGFEDGVVEALDRVGVRAVASYRLFPGAGELEPKSLHATLAKHQIDGALVAQLIAADTDAPFVSTTPYVVTGPGVGFYAYYHSICSRVYSSGSGVEEPRVVMIESNLYEIASGELMWSGLSATIDPSDVDDAVRSYAKAVTNALKRAELVGGHLKR
ncbi:hypothetical protein [Enhygromyxa salina]|uniref:hypothetical protein n=1 Tax=Enhygromyxa salina TaxID=215803 RepID=UPI0011B25DFE|nr:hypothetical protein [Enhygromyxa salina]